ncbi:MAG: uracil-DNA glycosylase [Ramlibacter sp.]
MLREMGLRLLPPAAPEGVAGMPAAQPMAAATPATAPAAPSAQALAAEVLEPVTSRVPVVPAPAGREAGIATLDWPELAAAVRACTACGLCGTRQQAVFGVGPQRADWMVIGEAPGETEDLQGEPFVGQAGKLLDSMLQAIGLDRQRNVYIANVLKCRPPGNRNPEPDEVAQCEPFLRRQVELVQPRMILAMGRFAVQALLQTQEPIGRLRGRPHQYQGVPVIVTYHPAYLLRNLPDKAKAWADLCLAQDLMAGVQAGASGR